MKRQNIIFLLLIYLIIPISCEREWNNPADENNTLAPEDWAPQDLKIEEISVTEKKLTWTYGDYNIQGFKLDRKKGNNDWQLTYKTFSKDTRSWTDTSIVPDPQLTYTYRLYTYVGNNVSSKNSCSTSAAIPSPSNFIITVNSVTSATLNWQDNSNGEEGFKIDRKVNEGTWQNEFATLNANQTTFTDNGLDLDTNVYTYRVYAYAGEFNSNIIEEIITLKIGITAHGGIVFYHDGNGHGLVCAESDQSTDAEWGCYGTFIGGTGTAIGTGAANTAAIVAGCSETGIAARICDELVLNGYDDWFLPSKDELNLMYENLKQAGIGGFADDLYWSSSEDSSVKAWSQNFGAGGLNQDYVGKGIDWRIRAVRAF